MNKTTRPLGILSVLPITASLLFLGATGAIADDKSCKAVVIDIGVVCDTNTSKKPAPSSSEPSKPKKDTPAPAVPEPAPVTAPAPAKAPVAPVPDPIVEEVTQVPSENTVVEEPKETAIVNEDVAKPLPAVTAPAAPATSEAVAVTPSASPTSSTSPDQTLAISGDPVADSQKSTFIPEFVFDVAPYVTVVSFLALMGMLVTARSKKLFPFEGRGIKA